MLVPVEMYIQGPGSATKTVHINPDQVSFVEITCGGNLTEIRMSDGSLHFSPCKLDKLAKILNREWD